MNQENYFSYSSKTQWSTAELGNDDFMCGSYDVLRFGIAQWLIIAITLPMPLHFTFRRIRSHLISRHRLRHGLCVACGYDIRATPQRCPECGHIGK